MTQLPIIAGKKVVVVEDHPLFGAMLVQLMEKELGMTVCGQTDNIREATRLIQETNPDLAIVDVTLHGSSGLELIKNLKAQGNPVIILVLSMHEESLYAERVLRAGAKGYISKREPPSEVVVAVRRVMAGQVYVSQRFTWQILERLGPAGDAAGSSGMKLLSDREIEVFQLLGCGLNSRKISERLALVPTTVDSYRARIKEKLGIKNAAELYQRAAQWVQSNQEAT